MRKILLGTTALIGAAAIVAGASAAAPELTISGNYDFHLVGGEAQPFGPNTVANDQGVVMPNDSTDIGKGGRDNGYRFNSADSISEIRFRAHGEADSGVKYGAVIDYRYLANTTDEAYIYTEGTFGRFHLGQDDGAVDHIMVGADSIAPGGYLINGWEVFLAPEANSTGDENKVVYFTPETNGFDAAVSLTDGNGIYEDIAEIGVRYHNDLFGVDYTVSGGYYSGSVVSRGGSKPTTLMSGTTEINPDDLGEWNIGVLLGYGPVKVAFAYGDEGDSGAYAVTEANFATAQAAATTASGTAAASRTPVQNAAIANAAAYQGVKTTGREHYNLGVAYDVGGGVNAGISYGTASKSTWRVSDNTTGRFSAEETTTVLALDVGFPLMEGMAGYAGVAFTEWERDGRAAVVGATPAGNQEAITGVSRDATTYVIGTTVSF